MDIDYARWVLTNGRCDHLPWHTVEDAVRVMVEAGLGNAYTHLEYAACCNTKVNDEHHVAVCSRAKAEFWTIYGRRVDGFTEAITDLACEQDLLALAPYLSLPLIPDPLFIKANNGAP